MGACAAGLQRAAPRGGAPAGGVWGAAGVSAGRVGWTRQAGERGRAGASTLTVPTLLLVAGDDAMVQAEGSHAFARAAPAGTVRLHGYDGLYHELFNEAQPGRDAVLDDLDHWLRERLSAGARSR